MISDYSNYINGNTVSPKSSGVSSLVEFVSFGFNSAYGMSIPGDISKRGRFVSSPVQRIESTLSHPCIRQGPPLNPVIDTVLGDTA